VFVVLIELQQPAHAIPVELGQHDVEEYQIRLLGACGLQRFRSIGSRYDLIASRQKDSLYHLEDGRAIVDRKDPRACHSNLPPDSSAPHAVFAHAAL